MYLFDNPFFQNQRLGGEIYDFFKLHIDTSRMFIKKNTQGDDVFYWNKFVQERVAKELAKQFCDIFSKQTSYVKSF